MPRTFHLDGACHCGAIFQRVRPLGPDALAYNYRETEGHPNQRPVLDGTTAYPAIKHNNVTDQIRRYFCARCGCHVFRSLPDRERIKWHDKSLPEEPDFFVRWGVATGILDSIASIVYFFEHVFVKDTRDGGAACWLHETHRGPLFTYGKVGRNYYTGKSSDRLLLEELVKSHPPILEQTQLEARCKCKAVLFHITRPTASQELVSPDIPDLLPKDTADTKWWLRENGKKYLAGLCACRTCRLTSGFEIQPWAFIPRANIFLQPESGHSTDGETAALDFDSLSSNVFTAYETSDAHVRHFCKTCGATVFAHEKSKPDLIRVSVGLFSAAEGTRAETWLKWWTQRIGYQEQAVLNRPPYDEYEENDVVDCFARDLAAWDGNTQ